MGSERQGLSAGAQALCDSLVCIPMRGRSDSLNLAVATGIMLYQLYDRRHPVTGPASRPS
jgi:TrmH family RNA methyltransferase